MNKIKVAQLDGDKMARTMWSKLIYRYLEVDLRYYDLGMQSCDALTLGRQDSP